MNKYSLKNIILHPFLLGLYPVVALLGHNISQMRISEATRATLVMLSVVTLVVILLRLIFRNWQQAAFMTTFLIVVFLSYGYLHDFLKQTNSDLPIVRHRFLIPFFLLVISIGFWWIKKVHDLNTWTLALNMIGLVAVVFPLYQIVSYRVITSIEMFSKRSEAASNEELPVSNDLVYRDVYYIILDAYARDDILQEMYGYDNSEFLDQLRAMGFYIAECSQSNYSKTSHALLSTLNLNYLDVLAGGEAKDIQNPPAFMNFSEVRKVLNSFGYTSVAFSTSYPFTELTEADIYLQTETINTNMFGPASAINSFEALLINTRGLILMDALSLFDIDILPQTEEAKIRSIVGLGPLKQRYAHVLNTLDELDNISSLPSPKFVFAHVVAPHEPYIFAADGTFIPQQEQNGEAYINQLSYVNQRIIPIISGIIKNSDTPPILIIQGDHGSSEVEYTPPRVMILNAYYLPNGGEQLLYSTITPVNTFRLILDYYFGSDYGLIEDISYNSKSKEDTFDYEVVPNLCDR